jgi:hypothetical protein
LFNKSITAFGTSTDYHAIVREAFDFEFFKTFEISLFAALIDPDSPHPYNITPQSVWSQESKLPTGLIDNVMEFWEQQVVRSQKDSHTQEVQACYEPDIIN